MQRRSQNFSVDHVQQSSLIPVTEIDQFPPTQLPTLGEVIGRVYYISQQRVPLQYANAIADVAFELETHWNARNVYTINHKHIKKLLTQAFNGTSKASRGQTKTADHQGYHVLKTTSEVKRSQSRYKEHCSLINGKLTQLFDICASEENQQIRYEKQGLPPTTNMDIEVKEIFANYFA